MQTEAPKINMDKARAGLPYDLNPMTVDSFNNPDDIILPGLAVARKAADDDGVKKPASGSDDIIGVALLNRSLVDNDQHAAKSVLSVMRKGRIWVVVEEAVAIGDDVYVRHTGKAQIQTFTTDADLITGNTIAVDVNGTTISQAFDTNNDTTMAAFAVKIAAHPDVASAVVSGSPNRVITITADSVDTDVTLANEAVTGGASQAGIVIAETQASIPNADRGKFRNDADSATAVQKTTWKWEVPSSGPTELAALHIEY